MMNPPGEGAYSPSYREYLALVSAVQQILERTGALMTSQERLDASVGRVESRVADLAGAVAALGPEIKSEIQDLKNALAQGVDVTAAVGRLDALATRAGDLGTQAQQMVTDLKADNPPATPAP